MRKSCFNIAALVTLAVLSCADEGLAASTAEIAGQRQASLNGILTTFPDRAIAAQRLTCMLGEEPDKVAKGRQAGKNFLPDAADTCVAVLVRTAHDGHLPDLYRTLLTELGGDVEEYAKLPLAIKNAVLDGDGKVPIGNGKVMDIVPSSLAFDAGFTMAYLGGYEKFKPDVDDPAQMKLLTGGCLAVQKDAGPCFAAGFAYGAQAFRARNTSSH